MNGFGESLGTTQMKRLEPCEPPSLLTGLKQRQSYLRQQLDDVNNAIEALESSPEVARVIELVGKVSKY